MSLLLVAPVLPARAGSTSPKVMRPGFADPSYYPVGADAVVVADFTGDGRADVAVASPAAFAPTTVALLVQTPSGALVESQQFSAHTGDLAFVSAAAADINGDGFTDLLVGSSGGIDLFEQHAGTLSPPRLISDLQAQEVDVADINGDGRPDLVVNTYFTTGLRTMLNLGGGQFAPPAVVSSGTSAYGKVEIGDVTGDGIPDLVGHFVISVQVRAGRGDGTFAPLVDYPIPWPYGGERGLALGDFDGDGRTDVAVTNSSNNPYARVWVFHQTPAGTLGTAVALATLDLPDMLEATDMNHDGRADLVTAHGGWDDAGVYLQQPDGTFGPEQLVYMGRWYFDASSGLDLGDVSGDGLPDIVVGSSGGLVVLRSTGLADATGGYHALTPSRILDTRNGTGGIGGPVGPGATVTVPVAGQGGVPASGVSAVVLNATVTQPSVGGFLTAFPSGTPRPLASNLNFVAGQTVPNLVVVKLGPDGKINLYNNVGTTHVILDVLGWYDDGGSSSGSRYNALVPSRILDTRDGTGGITGPIGPGATVSLGVTGRGIGGLPNGGASAVVLNVTVTQPTVGGFLTVFPGDTARPLASNLNFVAGQTVPNLVVVKLSDVGTISLYNDAGSTHVILDVVGWYGTSGGWNGTGYRALSPARILDTRNGTGGVTGPIGPGGTLTVPVAGRAGVPASGASAVVVNVTATQPSVGGFLTVFPGGPVRPLASSLNFVAGQTVPNLVMAMLGADGTISLYNNAGNTHVVVDVVGWYGV
jgi:hypothetical protein